MKLTKTIRYLVRVRDYETVHVEVGAEATHLDLGIDDALLATFDGPTIDRRWDSLQHMVEEEVERMARQELEQIASWSEISPNLAEDFLSTTPLPTTRSQNARTQKTSTPPTSRRIRRDPGRTTPPAA
jgi:hypothetical protein